MILLSTFTSAPIQQFQGYCFIGADYVYGPNGADQRGEKTGEAIGPGHDGCYVAVRRRDDGWEFGVDALGMARLFYYQADGIWAVSNSLARLVDHLRSHGVRLRPNYPQLAGLGSGALNTQMASFRTIFEGVWLAPSGCILLLHDGQLKMHRVEKEKRPDSYREGLSNFLQLWISRVTGLLADGRTHIECDLSGGIDSRTVFSIVCAAASIVDSSSEQIGFRSSENMPDDFTVAQSIAAKYGIPLNVPGPRTGTQLRARRTPISWRDACMGNYLLTYFYKVGPHPFAMHGHGGGGEIYRSMFPNGGHDKVVQKQEQGFPAHLYGVWRDDFLETTEHLKSLLPEMDVMQAHYREFRSRFHFGHRPHGSVVLSMLSSAALEFVSDYPAMVDSRQLYFDIMESLLPGLAYMAYDKEGKGPDSSNTRNLTVLDVRSKVTPGHIYAEDEWDSGMSTNGSHYGFDEFMRDGRAAVENPKVKSFVSNEKISNAKVCLAVGEAHGKFTHPNAIEAKDLAYCVTVQWVLGDTIYVG